MPMEGLKRRLSFRKKKKDKVPECSKPHQWQEDEKKVREGTCSFQVRTDPIYKKLQTTVKTGCNFEKLTHLQYLGCVEVFESRGMQVCEEAVKTLKAHCKGKYQRAILYVSGDALRVVDEINKSMIVDQTIEKVSFCAPDRNHEKGFAYICRDGTTRRWMCHGFLAVKESGERLSHAVGCAFAICLERKQKRDKENNVTVTYSQDRTCFERTGSFRQTTMTERLTDPQSAIVAEPVPVRSVDNPFALQRPHATQNMLVRQGSFRGFSKLQETTSPFKRTLSLRLNDLPSTLQRQNAVEFSPTKSAGLNNNGIIEEVPSPENEDSISQMCQQLTQGLTALNTKESDDPFASAPLQHSHPSGPIKQHSMPATFHSSQQAMFVHQAPAVHDTNPWSSPSPTQSVGASPKNNPTPPPPFSTNPFLSTSTTLTTTASPVSNGIMGTTTHTVAPHIQQHTRSHSMDTATTDFVPRPHANKQHTLLQMSSQHQSLQLNGGNAWPKSDWSANSTVQSSASSSITINQSVAEKSEKDPFDPFDVAWAAKGGPNGKPEAGEGTPPTNPFTTKTVTTYKMEL